MEKREGFVIIRRLAFDKLRQHCETCTHFDGSSQFPVAILDDNFLADYQHFTDNTLQQLEDILNSSQKSQQHEPNPTKAQHTEPEEGGERGDSREVRRFMKNFPGPNVWHERQKELELDPATEYEKIVRKFITDVSHTQDAQEQQRQSGNELVLLGQRLARVTASRNDAFASFRALLLLSYCAFLKTTGVTDGEIVQLISTSAELKFRPWSLVRGAECVNRCITALVTAGWTIFRATELFLINSLSPSDLSRIASDANYRSLLDHLIQETKSYKDGNWNCLSPRYTIPGLLWEMLASSSRAANLPSLKQVYAALGYGREVPRESIFTVQAAQTERSYVFIDYDSITSKQRAQSTRRIMRTEQMNNSGFATHDVRAAKRRRIWQASSELEPDPVPLSGTGLVQINGIAPPHGTDGRNADAVALGESSNLPPTIRQGMPWNDSISAQSAVAFAQGLPPIDTLTPPTRQFATLPGTFAGITSHAGQAYSSGIAIPPASKETNVAQLQLSHSRRLPVCDLLNTTEKTNELAMIPEQPIFALTGFMDFNQVGFELDDFEFLDQL
ncbi:hypothetical protein NA57DRAFT_52758 [Rhizodiscina lignyota]|uniref:Uncharacterized protein n=1 Tax=Rhizodiscina lignyota TaxID=1504668 RepID=A0A9P4IS19_9PEZI|nr:hypothetical protein NA57DRAFT_52758 [Rhizodiscina lignyota]